jgi:transcriptional regulator with XRE-family HTH domain
MTRSVHHPHYQEFLTLLRATRKATGITQTEVAERLHNRQVFVSKIERGDRRLDVIDLFEYCEAAGIDVVAFIQRLKRRLARTPKPRLGKLAVHAPRPRARKPRPARH